jgi:hypothetical protein
MDELERDLEMIFCLRMRESMHSKNNFYWMTNSVVLINNTPHKIKITKIIFSIVHF